MHFESLNNNIIELTELEYDPEEWMYLFDKFNLDMYMDKNGGPFGIEVCYDLGLLQEPVIKNLIDLMHEFKMRLDFYETKGTGQQGFQLARSQLVNGLFIHQDGFRPVCFTVPITYPSAVDFYSNKQGDDMWTYEYRNVPIFVNVLQWHGVRPSNERRLQFQIDIFNKWEELPNLIGNL